MQAHRSAHQPTSERARTTKVQLVGWGAYRNEAAEPEHAPRICPTSTDTAPTNAVAHQPMLPAAVSHDGLTTWRCLLAPLLILAVLGLALAAAPSASAQERLPGVAPEASEAEDPADTHDFVLGTFLPDPAVWASDVFTQALATLLRGVSQTLRNIVGGVLDSPVNFVSQTPPAVSYANPTVLALWEVVRAIANGALAVAVLWGGIGLVAGESLRSPYHHTLELLPRVAVAALLANTSLWWAQLAIDANNALCQAIGQVSLPSWEEADPSTQLFVDLVALLVYLVAGLLLVLQMLMRLALVNVLLVVAPLALLCWALPQTQGWARLWSGTFVGAVFIQFVQVVALKLGGALLTDLTPVGPEAALVALFLSVAVLALTLKLPGLVRGHMGDGLGFARYVVYRQGARALESRFAGRAGGR